MSEEKIKKFLVIFENLEDDWGNSYKILLFDSKEKAENEVKENFDPNSEVEIWESYRIYKNEEKNV